MLPGIDISHWQGDIDWKKVEASGKTFAFLKVTDGTFDIAGPRRYVDRRFAENATEAQPGKIVLGAYHFFRPTNNTQGQINSFLAMVSRFKEPFIPAVDLEPTKSKSNPEEWEETSKDERFEMVKKYLLGVERELKVKPVIYTSNFFMEYFMPLYPFFADYPLWLADYTPQVVKVPAPWKKFHFIQYSEKGKVDGIQGDVDLNNFDGTPEELQALCALRR